MSSAPKLTLREALALTEMVRASFVESGLTMAAFAATINSNPDQRAKFRHPLSANNIAATLKALGIEPNMKRIWREAREARERAEAERAAAAARPAPDLLARIEALERQVSELMKISGKLL